LAKPTDLAIAQIEALHGHGLLSPEQCSAKPGILLGHVTRNKNPEILRRARVVFDHLGQLKTGRAAATRRDVGTPDGGSIFVRSPSCVAG
jgi:hypothetical protein